MTLIIDPPVNAMSTPNAIEAWLKLIQTWELTGLDEEEKVTISAEIVRAESWLEFAQVYVLAEEASKEEATRE